ncbi:MAG: thermitase [Frankiaceae bacterium]|nr:thermitase [Frankiaceae bacterium]
MRPGRAVARGVLAAVMLLAPTHALAGPGAGAGTSAAPAAPVPCPVIFALAGRALLTGGEPPRAAVAQLHLTPAGGVPALGVHAYVAPSAAAAKVAVLALRSVPGVRWAELDRVRKPERAANDPLARWQWPLVKLGAQRAWDKDIGATNPVVVAVLDTGVDPTHPDLVGRVRAGFDWIDMDDDPRDTHFHGTSVSGVIAADTNNRLGVAGMSWGATILSERVLDGDVGGDDCGIAAGILHATQAGADVINMSLGGPGDCTTVLQLAVDQAHNNGVVVVASAGNDYKHGNPLNAPADCFGVVGVGATDRDDRVAPFSERNSSVDISAPGVHVLTTYRDPKTGRSGYAYLDGTSLSAPYVSGVAALIRSRHPTWSEPQVESRLLSTVRDLGPKGRDDGYGAGRLDAARALAS